MDNCRRRMLAHLGQPLYAKTEQRFDIRRRCRSRPFYYIIKVQVEAASSKIGPEYCRIAAFVLDRNGKLKFAIQVGPVEGALIVDLYNWVHSYYARSITWCHSQAQPLQPYVIDFCGQR